MTAPLDVIKEYLVSLGFAVNQPQYAKINQTIKDLTNKVESHTTGMAFQYTKAGGIITSALASISLATVGLMEHIAQADLGYQKYALRMYMARDAAKELKIVTDSMGESLKDIAWIPELRERYFSLMGQARGMEPGGGFESEMRYLRDIRFEFTRLKVEATYGLQWIGHNLFKYLGGPIKDAREGLKGMNDWIQQRMPQWTDNVARFLMVFVQLGKDALRLFKDLAPAIAAVGAYFVATSPLGRAVVILSSLLLLIDDFYAYIDGRKSAQTLRPMWHELIPAFRAIRNAVQEADKAWSHLWGTMTSSQKLSTLEWYLGKVGKLFDIVIERVLRLPKIVIGVWDTIGLLLSGDIKGAKARGMEVMKYAWNTKDYTGILGNQESGGNYGAVNADTGAKGKYQIMPKNWPSWAREAGLPENAPMTPENQDLVASHKFDEYLRIFKGDVRYAAAAWYAGLGYAKSLASGHPLYDPNKRMGKGGKYPSVNEYIQSYMDQTWGMYRDQVVAYSGGQGASSVPSINMGGVTINVPGTNASPDDIRKAVTAGMEDSYRSMMSRQIRELQGAQP